ncbi:class I SAM-dependent methyltransferase [Castellaniella sp.]|uniref:class I SAM-dependent methyltransferase n=1 Tax=Castellaniella sp. TaxID=1955812 RepID=UPI003A954A6E
MSRFTDSTRRSFVSDLRSIGVDCATSTYRAAKSFETSSSALFVHEFLRKPTIVGAVCPSSTGLARRMACPVPVQSDGLVVELGAGTGSVTQALLDRGVSPMRLRVVERSAALAQHLRRRFPVLPIWQADAADLINLLPEGATVDAVVSSLPLRSLTPQLVSAILDQWRSVLRPGGLLVQFTYALRGESAELQNGFAACDSSIVWKNMPPAKVMVFRRVDTLVADELEAHAL